MSQVVVHNGIAFLAGAVANDYTGDITRQTTEALANISSLLPLAGSSPSHLLTAQIWLRDIERDFDAMNAAWEAWVPSGTAPTRATCQAKMAHPDILIEIVVTAAVIDR